jgi:hypothetical protein
LEEVGRHVDWKKERKKGWFESEDTQIRLGSLVGKKERKKERKKEKKERKKERKKE